MLAAIDDAEAFFRRQSFEFGEQSLVQGRGAIGEQVHKHRTARGDFARLVSARALVAFQTEKLKTVSERHSGFIVMPKETTGGRRGRRPRTRGSALRAKTIQLAVLGADDDSSTGNRR